MGKHKNQKQEEILLNKMKDQPEYARGFVKGDRVVQEEWWKNLANALNLEGPPEKDVNGWKKVWLDWKANVKRKLVHNSQEVRQTGGGAYNQYILTHQEEEIAVMSGMYVAVDGIPNAQSFGVPAENNKENDSANSSLSTPHDEEVEVQPSTSNSSKRKRQSNLDELLQDEVNQLESVGGQLEKISKNNELMNDTFEKIDQKLGSIDNRLENLNNKYDIIIELKKSKLEEKKRHNLQKEQHYIKIERSKVKKIETKLKSIEVKKLKVDAMKGIY